MQLDVAGRSENFLVDTGATYSVLIPTPGPSPPKPVPFWVLQEKQLLKDSPKHFYKEMLGWTNIFPPVSGGPQVSYSLIGKRYTH